MNKTKNPNILTIVTGFAIFTMLFGAGDFMIPPTLGILAGQKSLFASLVFNFTAVVLPILGLIASFLFEGNYREFFLRLGKIPGSALIAICMFIIGPGLVLPRIVTLCYSMINPYVPVLNLLVFAILFSTVTFLLTYRPTKFIDVLGYLITPIKLAFVGFMIVLGLLTAKEPIYSTISSKELLGTSLLYGYGTLGLLGTIFFGSVIFEIFKKNFGPEKSKDTRNIIKQGLISSVIGGTILSLVYVGMTFLGAFHGAGLEGMDEGSILSAVSIRIIGNTGGFFAALAIMVACLATMIALSTVISEYIQKEITKNRLNFVYSLLLVLGTTIILSLLGLKQLMNISRDLAFVLYPVLIALTVCNMAYKLFNFKPVKTPVLAVLLFSVFIKFGGIDFCQDCYIKYCSPEICIEKVTEKTIS